MFMTKARLLRLAPLASLVLAACSIHQPSGPAKSPDSPQWLQHKQQVQKITQIPDAWCFCLSDSQKYMFQLATDYARTRFRFAD